MDDQGADDTMISVIVGEERTAGSDAVVEQVWQTDPVCAQAVDVARSALLAEADEAMVGEHCGLVADGPLVVTHYFEGRVPGYTGWRWSATVTRAPDSDQVTVDETALLPDGDALLAPAWVPWKQRIQSGDLGVGDLLVTEADDPRLLPGLTDNDDVDQDEQLRPLAWELGLGRVRTLSPEGRREAAHRWYREMGPRASKVRGTGLDCASCGFLMLIGGPLGQAFGVCANGYSPADGRIVAMTFGCGAHSETVQSPSVIVAETVVDEFGFDEMAAGEEPTEDATAYVEGGDRDTDDDHAPATDAGEAAQTEPDAEPEPERDLPVQDAEPPHVDPAAAADDEQAHATMQEPTREEDA